MTNKRFILVLALGAALMAGGAHAQEARKVGIDEAAALARVLKAEILATQKIFSMAVEFPLKRDPNAKCAAEVNEIRGHIHGAAHAHFEIRESYESRRIDAHFHRGVGHLRAASAIMGECFGTETTVSIHHHRLVFLGQYHGQTDLLTYYINRRDQKREAEEKKLEEERAARQVEGQ